MGTIQLDPHADPDPLRFVRLFFLPKILILMRHPVVFTHTSIPIQRPLLLLLGCSDVRMSTKVSYLLPASPLSCNDRCIRAGLGPFVYSPRW